MTLPERVVSLEEQAEACDKKHSDVETRLRRIERSNWYAAGAVAGVLTLVQLIFKYVL